MNLSELDGLTEVSLLKMQLDSLLDELYNNCPKLLPDSNDIKLNFKARFVWI